MRIVRGFLKSRRIPVPKGFNSRPTTNFAKEGLLNVLDNHIDLDGIDVLDGCCGTGNMSFEFVSCGAKRVVSVDKNFACIRYLHGASKDLGISEQLFPYKADLLKYLDKCTETFDLIFFDPPFDLNIQNDLLHKVRVNKLLREDGILVIEHGKQTVFDAIEPDVVKKYGNVYFSVFKKLV